MTDKIELPLVSLLVERNRDRLHIQIPEHEVAIQKRMNPEGAVAVVPVDDPVVEAFDADAGAEYARLVRKYNRINSPNPASAVYPGPEALVPFGFKLGNSEYREPPKSSVEDKRPRASASKKVEK